MSAPNSIFVRACKSQPVERTPVWFMRQAGRYMPEYRAVRKQHSLLEICKNPTLAAEVTITAAEILDVDAAIIFADLLLPLEVMDLPFHFSAGEGPVIERPVRTKEDIARLRTDRAAELGYVSQAVAQVARHFAGRLPVIGFCGAPFTLASYMIEGGGSRNYVHTKKMMYNSPHDWDDLMRKLVAVTAAYSAEQVRAGADAIQIFDSWVGCLSVEDYRRYVLPHAASLIAQVQKANAPIIYFGTDSATLLSAMRETGAEVIGLDWRVPLDDGWRSLQHRCAVQGNLDPVLLFANWKELKSRAEDVLHRAARRPGHIFNLGHGILPETPVDNVKNLARFVQEYSASGPRHTAPGTERPGTEAGKLASGTRRPEARKPMHMTRIAIIGGGISGLSAAFTCEERRRSGAAVEYVLYESSTQLGGVLRTEHIEGCLVEAGPDSFITEKPWAADLCRTLGLGDQLIGSNDADRKTYILVNGRLVVMPDGLMFMVPTKVLPTGLSPLFSWKTKLRMAQELLHPPRAANGDESVASLVERHYGQEMVDRLADPLLSGVYGGEAANLSVRAVLPRFAEMERQYGSLTRAMLAARKKMARFSAKPAAPLFTSLKNGMQHLPETVVSRLTPSWLLTNTLVQRIHPEDTGWMVESSSGGTDSEPRDPGLRSRQFDAVILALPAHSAAQLLATVSPELSAELAAIDYSSSITVGLAYHRDVRGPLPPGFGFLVPRSEGKRLLAATFVHNKFPHRAPEDRALLRCFLAGANAEAAWQLSDDQIVMVVRDDLQQILGLRAEPLFTRVYKWRSAMAQYGVGHLERLERIERLRQKLSGLALAGNGYRGIGVPDCIRSGQEAAQEALSRSFGGR